MSVQVKDDASRKTWDKDEYAAKARDKDAEAEKHAAATQAALRKGKKPPRKREVDNLPKPKQLAQAREGSLELEKNLGKVMVVASSSGRGPGAPGYYCDECKQTFKDSIGYLDHINSRRHLRKLGQTTRVKRSTLDGVRQRIAQLREQTAARAKEKQIDFDERINMIKAEQNQAKADRKEQKKLAKAAARGQDMDVDLTPEQQDIKDLMGFAGFGTSSKN